MKSAEIPSLHITFHPHYPHCQSNWDIPGGLTAVGCHGDHNQWLHLARGLDHQDCYSVHLVVTVKGVVYHLPDQLRKTEIKRTNFNPFSITMYSWPTTIIRVIIKCYLSAKKLITSTLSFQCLTDSNDRVIIKCRLPAKILASLSFWCLTDSNDRVLIMCRLSAEKPATLSFRCLTDSTDRVLIKCRQPAEKANYLKFLSPTNLY